MFQKYSKIYEKLYKTGKNIKIYNYEESLKNNSEIFPIFEKYKNRKICKSTNDNIILII